MSEGWDYYHVHAHHPRQAESFTWNSVDRIVSFDGFQFASLIAPRPLLVVIGRTAITAANSTVSYDNAKDPKQIFWIEGASHADLYYKEQFVPGAVAKLTEFFDSNLQSKN